MSDNGHFVTDHETGISLRLISHYDASKDTHVNFFDVELVSEELRKRYTTPWAREVARRAGAEIIEP